MPLPMMLAVYTGPPNAPVNFFYENPETASGAENILIKSAEDLDRWYSNRLENDILTTLPFYVFPESSPENPYDVEQWCNGFFSPELSYHTQKVRISNEDILEIKFSVSSEDGKSTLFIAMKKDKNFIIKILTILEKCWQEAGLSLKNWSKRFG